jgi:hypothetical protein
MPLKPAILSEQIVEQVIDLLADTALQMWPVWFTDVDFGDCRNDTLGREAARLRGRQATSTTPAVLLPWAENAVILALDGRKPFIGATGASAKLKEGVLADALRYFSRDGADALEGLIDILSELPEGVSQIGNARSSRPRLQISCAQPLQPIP